MRRRKKPNSSAGPHSAWAATQEGPLRDDDARLQAPRHDDVICGVGDAARQGHRSLLSAASPSGVSEIPTHAGGRVSRRCSATPYRRQLWDAQASEGAELAEAP